MIPFQQPQQQQQQQPQPQQQLYLLTTYLTQGIEAAFCSEEDKAALRLRFESFYAECEVCAD